MNRINHDLQTSNLQTTRNHTVPEYDLTKMDIANMVITYALGAAINTNIVDNDTMIQYPGAHANSRSMI